MPVDEQGREYDESWDLASGLIDDVDAVVVGSEFGYRPEYTDAEGNPQTLFILKILPDGESEPQEVHYSVGKGWEPSPDGRSISRPDGKRRPIRNSMYGHLIQRAVGLYPEIRFRGPATEVGAFDGTKWHWKRETIEYGGRLQAREHLMPTSFLGLVQSAARPSQSDVVDELTALAIAHDTHAAFVKAFLADKELQQRVKDAGLLKDVLNSKADGFWHKARAEAGIA